MGFFSGFVFGALAGNYFAGRSRCEDCRRRRFNFTEEKTEKPGDKTYYWDSDDYRMIFKVIKKGEAEGKIDVR